MPWWEIIGWAGSVLVVLSLVVPSVRKFRALNLTGSLIATVYNVVFGIWPYAAMNAVIALIDVHWLWRLHRQGERHYSVCPVGADSALVARFVERHRQGIAGAHPGFASESLAGTCAYLTLCDDEVIGLFILRVDRGGQGRVLLDYVTDRFRDLTPGKVLYADAQIRAGGLDRLTVDPTSVTDTDYFRTQGFVEADGLLVRTFEAAAQ
ncbi:hypothetical protein I6B53_08845 [Schaalia sp. 19OD2882]|nr:hypothetical protein I6B53_08845 [Schaalia sp. 19OD2882]